MAVCLVACISDKIYYHFQHVEGECWDRSDTIRFEVPTLREGGLFSKFIALRTNGDFRYRKLEVVVTQEVFPAKYIKRDTVDINLIDGKGNISSGGIRFYQFEQSFGSVRLMKGDSLHISINHNMRREDLNGITDVGVCLRRK